MITDEMKETLWSIGAAMISLFIVALPCLATASFLLNWKQELKGILCLLTFFEVAVVWIAVMSIFIAIDE